MGTPISVRGKLTRRPGVYTDIKSGIKNPQPGLDYGNICIIDTNLSNGWAAGAGINGELTNGANAISAFDNIDDFRSFLKGGYLWLLAEPLFLPDGPNKGISGVSNVYYVKPATTTAATLALTGFENGALTFKTKNEGTGANGVLTSSNLSKGYAVKLIAGIQDTSKYILQFWVGNFHGLDSQNGNTPYDGIAAADAKPKLVAYTPEVSSIDEIIAWCADDFDFNENFVLASSTATPIAEVLATATGVVTAGGTGGDTIVLKNGTTTISTYTTSGTQTPTAIGAALVAALTGGYTGVNASGTLTITGPTGSGATLNSTTLTFTITGGNGATATNGTFTGGVTATTDAPITSTDLTTYVGYTLATGATETYSSTDFDDVLTQIKDLDNTFFLCTDYNTNATALNNSKLLDFVSVQTKYEKYLYIAGGNNKNQLKGTGSGVSEAITKFFDSDNVVVPHGGSKKAIFGSPNFKVYDSLYFACEALGRTCGLEPQTPITLKSINVDGAVYALTDDDQEFCIKKGILYFYYDTELSQWVIGQGINSLQNNNFLVNEDGTSFSIAVKRICTQLNKEIIYNAKRKFFGGEQGPNRNTITEVDIKTWLEGYLKSRQASTQKDDLIIRFGNINVEVDQDNYFVTYEFVPNFEVSKIIFTGFILDK